jgi:hypothetical protein
MKKSGNEKPRPARPARRGVTPADRLIGERMRARRMEQHLSL